MKLGRLVARYFAWHYSTAFVDLWRVCTNFLWFIYNLFSISFLLGTLFDPFERIRAEHVEGDMGDFFSALVANTLMRIVGAVTRLFVIVIGIILLIVTLMLSVCAFVVWPLVPFIIVILLTLGIPLLA